VLRIAKIRIFAPARDREAKTERDDFPACVMRKFRIVEWKIKICLQFCNVTLQKYSIIEMREGYDPKIQNVELKHVSHAIRL